MDIQLTDTEIRVMGSLMEKSLTTPDYYPLSLNALTNACNQKSSRDPVVAYDEAAVEAAVDLLIQKHMVHRSDASRVAKFEELLSRRYSLIPRETGVLCVLLLRGPQTVGELRARTSRMCRLDSIEEVSETLNNLEELGFARRLPRWAGHKESRYAHLLAAESSPPEEAAGGSSVGDVADGLDERVDALELKVAALRSEIEALNEAFGLFKKQFE
jgi:uncharacterized protein YceH (UPF0502 family)